MKKLILMVAMVFATSGLVNANSSVEYVKDDCASWAWEKADELNEVYSEASGHSYSDWDLWELTESYYEECISKK